MELFKRMFSSKNKVLGVNKKINSKSKVKKQDYFTLAKTWNDDIYTQAVISRNRYKIVFYWAAGLATLLVLSVIMLAPMQHTELVVSQSHCAGKTRRRVHQHSSGR